MASVHSLLSHAEPIVSDTDISACHDVNYSALSLLVFPCYQQVLKQLSADTKQKKKRLKKKNVKRCSKDHPHCTVSHQPISALITSSRCV